MNVLDGWGEDEASRRALFAQYSGEVYASRGTSSRPTRRGIRLLDELAEGMGNGLTWFLCSIAQIVGYAFLKPICPLRLANFVDNNSQVAKVKRDVLHLRRGEHYWLLCSVRKAQFIEYIRIFARKISEQQFGLLDLFPDLLDHASRREELIGPHGLEPSFLDRRNVNLLIVTIKPRPERHHHKTRI